jgi:hypothetical protein
MEGEGVIAASTQDFGAGKRYDLGHDTPQSLTRGLFRFAKNLLPLLAAAALLLPACSSDDDPAATPEGKTRITLTAGIDEVTTRTTYTDGGTGTGTDGNPADKVNVVWTSGTDNEKLSAVIYNNNNPSSVQPDALTGSGTGTKSMTFSGTVTQNTGGTLGEDAHNYFYDPAGKADDSQLGERGQISFGLSSQTCNVTAPLEGLKNYDIMYTEEATDKGNITLKHACALVRFNLPLDTDKVITQITMSANNSGTLCNRVILTYDAAGKVTATKSGDGTLTLNITGDDATTHTRTLEAYLMLPVASDGTTKLDGLLVKVSAIATDGTVYSRMLNLTEATNETLLGGKCYTFFGVNTDTPLAEDRWAGSNIYHNGSSFTFHAPNVIRYTNYQGLFFKWGSTVGIAPNSPVGSWYTYPKVGASNPGSDWGAITYDGSTDLCTTISSAYRMPTLSEMQALVDLPATDKLSIGTWESITSTTTNRQGTTLIPSGIVAGNVFFPAAGSITDSLGEAGIELNYWSSNATGAVFANSLYAWKSATPGTSLKIANYGKDYGFSIRCIKKTDAELSE